MATSFVQAAENAAHNVSTLSQAYTSSNTAGNCLVIAIGAWKSSVFTTPVVTDSQGNTWKRLIAGPQCRFSGVSQCFIFAALNCAGGANTVTVTIPSSVTVDLDMAIQEYSGVSHVNALDQSGGVANGSTALSFSLTTQFANEVLFCLAYDQSNSSSTFASTAGWNARVQTSNPGAETLKTFDQLVSTTGVYSNTVTRTGASSNGYSVLSVSLSDTAKSSPWIQSDRTDAVGTATISRVFPANNGSGDLLIAAIGAFTTGTLGTISAVTDSLGNTWLPLASSPLATTSGQSRAFLYYVASSLSGTNTVTVTASASCDMTLEIFEYSSVIGAIAHASAATSGIGPFSSISSGAISTTGVGMMFSVCYDQSNQLQGFTSTFAGNGWNQRENATCSSRESMAAFDQIPGSGNYNQVITVLDGSLGLHCINVGFTGGSAPQPVVFVIT